MTTVGYFNLEIKIYQFNQLLKIAFQNWVIIIKLMNIILETRKCI